MRKGGLVALIGSLAVFGFFNAIRAHDLEFKVPSFKKPIYEQAPASASIDQEIDKFMHCPPLQLASDTIVPVYRPKSGEFLGALEMVAGFEDSLKQEFDIKLGIRSLRCGEPSNLNISDFKILVVYPADEGNSEVWGVSQDWIVRTLRNDSITRKTSYNVIRSGLNDASEKVGNYTIKTASKEVLGLPVTLLNQMLSIANDVWNAWEMESLEAKYGLRFLRPVRIEVLPTYDNLSLTEFQDVIYRHYKKAYRSSQNERPYLFFATCRINETVLVLLNRGAAYIEAEITPPRKH